jgi:hypothetical protein
MVATRKLRLVLLLLLLQERVDKAAAAAKATAAGIGSSAGNTHWDINYYFLVASWTLFPFFLPLRARVPACLPVRACLSTFDLCACTMCTSSHFPTFIKHPENVSPSHAPGIQSKSQNPTQHLK